MNLKKCPICEMPNDAESFRCEECGHEFDMDLSNLTRDEVTAIFQKERAKYRSTIQEKVKEEHHRELYSIWHLSGYYVINILAIMGIIMLLNRFGFKIDILLHSVAVFFKATLLPLNHFAVRYYTIKYAIAIILFQFFFNMLQLRNVDKKIVLVIFNFLVILGLASFAISYKLMMSNY
jgi:hypothetical protein